MELDIEEEMDDKENTNIRIQDVDGAAHRAWIMNYMYQVNPA